MKTKLVRWANRLGNFFNSRAGLVVGLSSGVGAFLALTLTRLTASSIWFDESYSAYLMRYGLADITRYTAVDVHPPFYYYMLKAWTCLFGTSPAALRSLSVVLGVAALLLLFILVRKSFNQRTALLAVLLTAVSPMFVRYGIEARMYMLAVCLALGASIVLLRALETERRRYYLLYGVLICLGMYTHYFSAVVWLAYWVYRYIYYRQQGLQGKKLWKTFWSSNWLLAHALAVIAYVPWLPIAYHQFSGVTSNGFWIPAVTINTPGDWWADIMFYLEGWRVDGWYAVALLTVLSLVVYCLVRSYRRNRQLRPAFAFVAVVSLCPPLFLILLSCYPFKSVFVDRYLMTSVVMLTALMAVGIVWSGRRHLSTITLVAVLACFGYGIYNVYFYGNYNRYGGGLVDKVTLTGELVERIRRDSPNGTPIIAAMSYGYYEAAAYDSADHPVYFLWDDVKNDQTGSLQMLRDNKLGKGITDLNKFTKQHQYIWRIGSNGEATIAPPNNANDWHVVKTITARDPVSGEHHYKATLYKVE